MLEIHCIINFALILIQYYSPVFPILLPVIKLIEGLISHSWDEPPYCSGTVFHKSDYCTDYSVLYQDDTF